MSLRLFSLVSVLCAAAACDRGPAAEHQAPPAEPSRQTAPRAKAPAELPAAARVQAKDEKPPPGYAAMTVGGVAPTSHGNAVVLTDAKEKVGVFIFVGGTEALSLALRLSKREYERPLTHDLLDDMLSKMEARVVSVRVDKLEKEVFHGTVVLGRDDRRWELDARPSDAIALAVGNAAPIFVADGVIAKAGVDLEGVEIEKPGVSEPDVEAAKDTNAGIEL